MADSKLVVFADYVCPFCYLAEAAVARVRAEGLVEVEAAAVELRPAGTGLPAADAPAIREAWERTVEPLARELGVAIRCPAIMTRTRKAHEAVAFARERGRFEAMHEAVYRAYWQEGRDIGRIDVLAGIGEAAGLDPMELRVELDIDKWSERVEQDAARAAMAGVNAVPAYLLTAGSVAGGTAAAGELRAGLQRYDELRAWVTR